MTYILHVLIVVNIYGVLAVSLCLLAGWAGRLSVCHAGFFGLGAYASAILCTKEDWSWVATLPIGAALCVLVSAIVGFVSLRFREDYFVIATLGFQVILFNVLQNWVNLTEGPRGISGIPNPRIGPWHVESHLEYLLLVLILSVTSSIFVARIVLSPYGRVLRAIREDEVFAQALAKNVALYKVSAFMIGALLASLSGSLYASYMSYIEPGTFTVDESILLLAIVIIGGSDSILGSLLGTLLVVALPEALRFVGLPSSVAANVRQVVYGLVLVAFMLTRPQGILGTYSFTRSSDNA